MEKSFDDLFNEFFGNKNINPDDKLSSSDRDKTKKLIEILSKIEQNPNLDELAEKEMDDTLGTPDKIEFYNEGDTFFEKRIWYTSHGEIQKLAFSKDPTLILPEQYLNLPINLEKKLEEAVKNEEFEKAAIIRDEIKNRDKVKRTRKKK